MIKSISAIHPVIMENTKNILKCVLHISIRESHNASISEMLNSFHNIVNKAWCEECLSDLCLALKQLRVYRKSSPYAVVKKEWEIKGVQR